MRQFTYSITNPVGLHARPAGLLVETVKGMSSTVRITKEDKTAPADRLMALMLLDVCKGDSIVITVEGPQEEQDAAALLALLQAQL